MRSWQKALQGQSGGQRALEQFQALLPALRFSVTVRASSIRSLSRKHCGKIMFKPQVPESSRSKEPQISSLVPTIPHPKSQGSIRTSYPSLEQTFPDPLTTKNVKHQREMHLLLKGTVRTQALWTHPLQPASLKKRFSESRKCTRCCLTPRSTWTVYYSKYCTERLNLGKDPGTY